MRIVCIVFLCKDFGRMQNIFIVDVDVEPAFLSGYVIIINLHGKYNVE
jgi:hypothetical protein